MLKLPEGYHFLDGEARSCAYDTVYMVYDIVYIMVDLRTELFNEVYTYITVLRTLYTIIKPDPNIHSPVYRQTDLCLEKQTSSDHH